MTVSVETKAAFAKRLNISAQRVSAMAKNGLPVDPTGKVYVDAGLKWVKQNIRADAGRPLGSSNGGGGADLEAEKTRLTRLQADRAELELAARRGELVPREDAQRANKLVAYTTRELMMNFPAKHGAEIAGELGIDPGTLIGLLEAHIRKALVKAAEQPIPEFMREGKL